MSEMLKILTPIVAQSSVEASLTIMLTLPVCPPPPPSMLELEPQAVENNGSAASTIPNNKREALEFICPLSWRHPGLLDDLELVVKSRNHSGRASCPGYEFRPAPYKTRNREGSCGEGRRNRGTEVLPGNSGQRFEYRGKHFHLLPRTGSGQMYSPRLPSAF